MDQRFVTRVPRQDLPLPAKPVNDRSSLQTSR